MADAIDDVTLFNCTGLMLLQLDPSRNLSYLFLLNRTQLVETLDSALDEVDNLHDPLRRTAIRDFISECLFPASRPYDLAWWQKLMWTIIFAAMLLVSTGGNTIVMWIVLGK